MSTFDDVKQATCQILKDDGQSNSGTGFFILPGGYLLTCHHVIFGLKRLQVKIPSEQEPYEAEYVEEYSDLKSDFAVLRVPTISITPVQLGHTRLGNEAYAYGFRPSSVAVEPKGHSYSGQIGPGQQLQFPIPSQLLSQLQGLPPEERQTWNNLPPENAFRIGDICNFQGTWGLEKGISGGPVYDPQLRRVVGMFRAVEGDEHAYILPIDNVFEHWADLEKKNRDQVIDTPLDQLERYFGVRLLGEGAKPIHSVSPRYFDSVISKHAYFGGRKEELKALNDFVGEKCTGYFFITGPPGFGKTALLTQWIKQLRLQHVVIAFHFITPRVRCGTEAEFYFENLCCQLLEFHGLGGELPPREKLPLLYADLLKLAPLPERRIVLILDGLDEAIGRWEPSWVPGSDIFPQDLAEGIQVVFSACAIADKDWLEDLKLSLSDDHVIVLGQLSLTDIKDALNQSDIFSGTTSLLDQAARHLLDLSEGDPFYFQDLLLDLEQSNGDLERLDRYPIGHSNYLKQWWQDAYTDNPAFVDLMGTLTIARAPLGRKELINISKDDEIRGATFHKLTRQVARYLSGSQTEGYQISHNRIREFIQDQLEDEIEVYRNRFVKFCWHWRDAPKGSPRDYLYPSLWH